MKALISLAVLIFSGLAAMAQMPKAKEELMPGQRTPIGSWAADSKDAPPADLTADELLELNVAFSLLSASNKKLLEMEEDNQASALPVAALVRTYRARLELAAEYQKAFQELRQRLVASRRMGGGANLAVRMAPGGARILSARVQVASPSQEKKAPGSEK